MFYVEFEFSWKFEQALINDCTIYENDIHYTLLENNRSHFFSELSMEFDEKEIYEMPKEMPLPKRQRDDHPDEDAAFEIISTKRNGRKILHAGGE